MHATDHVHADEMIMQAHEEIAKHGCNIVLK